MRKLSLGETAETAQSRPHELLGLIRGACEALLSTQPSIIASITVARAIEHHDSAAFILKTSRRVAQEYGLRAEPRFTEAGFAVRLTRSAGHLQPLFSTLSPLAYGDHGGI
jgi:hypothetical protein